MRAADTDVLIRLITRDDARQAAAADRFVEKGAWVSVLALAEAMWVLSSVYERGPKEQAKAIEMLLDHRELVLQDSDIVSAALAALGFSDCLMPLWPNRAENALLSGR